MKAEEQLVWVMYDITDDRNRRRIVKATQEAGLYRVQYSVFLGTIRPNRLDELCLQIEDNIDEDNDRVYIFPMCSKDFKKVVTYGQAFDEKLINDEVKALFF